MLQNQEQESAIQELVKNGTIQNFSKENMKKLVEKGNSTYEEDMKKFVDFMSEFQPAIMDIGSDIEDVEKKVNEKAQKMKPYSQVENVSLKQGKEGKGKG